MLRMEEKAFGRGHFLGLVQHTFFFLFALKKDFVTVFFLNECKLPRSSEHLYLSACQHHTSHAGAPQGRSSFYAEGQCEGLCSQAALSTLSTEKIK